MTGIDLILIFFSSLFTSGFSAEVDLIHKSKLDDHTIGLVSTSQGSYYVNSTLDDYDGGDNSIPFAWRPPTLDDIDFLQFDFRVPHKILKAAVILNPFGGETEDGAPLMPQPTKFFVALSKVGSFLNIASQFPVENAGAQKLRNKVQTFSKTLKLQFDITLKIG